MRSGTMRFMCRMLIVSLVMLPFQTVQAGIIGTDQVVPAAQVHAARATVLSQISRAEVADQLQAFGLTAQNAKDRMAALTDAEVTKLAGQIDKLPAGAHSNPVSVLLVFILVGVLIWWAIKR